MNVHDWREHMLAYAPDYAALLYATPIERMKLKLSLPRFPQYEPGPLPPPQWICRPASLAVGEAYLQRKWDCWRVILGPMTREFDLHKGLHRKRNNGRKTRHGRLNVRACEAIWDAYVRSEDARRAQHDAIVKDTWQEITTRAVRSGTGWIYARVNDYRYRDPMYLIRVPERNVWALAVELGCVYTDDEVIEVIEEGPPARAPLPSMTWEDIRVTLTSVGCDLNVVKNHSYEAGRVSWKGIDLYDSILSVGGGPIVVLFGKEATPQNLCEGIQNLINKEIQRKRDQVAKLLSEIDTLSTF